MKMMIKTILSAAAIAVTSSGAFAATLTASYDVTSAESSNYNSSGGHSVWLPNATSGSGSADHFDFVAPSKFDVFSDGSATMTGVATHETTGSANGFAVSVLFQAATGTYAGKEELSGNPYGNGLVDKSTWEYFNLVTGTLTGFGTFAGQVFDLTEKPDDGSAPFQLGAGANGKNLNFGGSGWFAYTVNGGTDMYRGDFNVDLTKLDLPPMAPVPLPASALLLIGAIGGLGVMRKRKAAA